MAWEWKQEGPAPDGKVFGFIEDEHGEIVIGPSDGFDALKTTPENARLLAAAPDLLDVARRLMVEEENGLVWTMNTRYEELIERCRAAIAKAEGRE